MLTKIILKNYTTFISETVFDFKATQSKILDETNVGVNRVLKGAIFVGENASGKTQVLKSIVLMLDVLFENELQNYSLKKSLYSKGDKYSVSYFFDIEGKEINYKIEFKGNSIYSEKLFVSGDEYINRLGENAKISIYDDREEENIVGSLSIVKKEYGMNRFNNDVVLNKWFEFLMNSMFINSMLGSKTVKSYNTSRLSEQFLDLYKEKNSIKEINNFLSKIGYNSEVVFKDSFESEKFISNSKKSIYLRKKDTEVDFPLLLESTGNLSLMSTILPILFATKNNSMIIIDEFSGGMHNELEEALVKYFFNNSSNAQLFFTSHSTNLLDTSILRPDQIYSFEFDSKKGTQICRFSDENPRESQNIEKIYLSGGFNGMPKYNKKFKI